MDLVAILIKMDKLCGTVVVIELVSFAYRSLGSQIFCDNKHCDYKRKTSSLLFYGHTNRYLRQS